MKVLNLYAGLGGNRRLWEGVEVTAVEIDQSVARYYSDHYPHDEMIIGDAHEFLKKHYREFDFIWSSVNCPTHSRARFWASRSNEKVLPVFPDMKLYEEILFLQHYFDGKWIVENVKPFYDVLIRPTIAVGRHLFWSNFPITKGQFIEGNMNRGNINEWQGIHDVDISNYTFSQRRDKVLRNYVNHDLGLHILNCAKGNNEPAEQLSFFGA